MNLPRLALALLSCLAAPLATAGTPAPPGVATLDRVEALRTSQAAIGRTIGDFTLLDRNSRPVNLAVYRGKPLVVNFIYTGCFQVCPTATRNLERAVTAAMAALGESKFNVVSIGFNQPEDSPAALRSYALANGIDRPGWDFLSPPAEVVPELARDFGFRFLATPAGFDHTLQVTLVDTEGRIATQIYGETFAADSLVEALKRMLAGKPIAPATGVGDVIEKIRLLCSVFDPRTGEYRTNYSLLAEIGGGLTFFIGVIVFLYRERRSHARFGA